MGGAKKLHVGFPEKALDKYLVILVNNGFMVAVIEQTETPKQLEERNKSLKPGAKREHCVRREICNVVTKGIYNDPNSNGFQPKFVLAIKRYGTDIGITFFDLATMKFYVGQFTDDEPLSNFRTLICQIRPVEVLIERELITSDIVKMLKNTPIVPVFTPMQPKDCWGVIKTCTKLDNFLSIA
jgi:DNA mismatch repair protein MSH6